jgi:hypothetical protein
MPAAPMFEQMFEHDRKSYLRAIGLIEDDADGRPSP